MVKSFFDKAMEENGYKESIHTTYFGPREVCDVSATKISSTVSENIFTSTGNTKLSLEDFMKVPEDFDSIQPRADQ
eukprot:14621034-Ditylum_brightwellii.AAC.1